ncbi:hypothetical protein ACFQ0B_24625 [Nonomuraea thailandensis]
MLLALIPVLGVVFGALSTFAGVALTNRANLRKEERQAERQALERWEQSCQQSAAELLGAVARLRMRADITGQRAWADLSTQLVDMQEQAIQVVVHAGQVALLKPGAVGDAARDLGEQARSLVTSIVGSANLIYDAANGEHFGGELLSSPDFKTLEAKVDRFYEAAAAEAGMVRNSSALEPAGNRAGKLKSLLALRRK